MPNQSNQPRSGHSDTSFSNSNRTLEQAAGHRSWHQPSRHGEHSANHLSEVIRHPENPQPGSLNEPANGQGATMSNSHSGAGLRLIQSSGEQPRKFEFVPDSSPAPDVFNPEPQTPVGGTRVKDPLLTAEEVAERLNVTKDWVWDHSSRKSPHLPVIRMGDGTLRYRASRIEEFIDERERLTNLRRRRG
jgi:predicted DNA-binding transcriptional regulator AlpA